jgi:transposase-like protein
MAKQTLQMSTKAFDKLFPNEEACDAFLIARRWPGGVRCPRCGSKRVYPLQTLQNKWECPDCREGGAYRFSHLVGTIFENTNLDLLDWFKVIHLMLTSKKGISARQIHRYMGFGSYKTAWYVCHRVRAALQDKDFRKLMGIVEVDETYFGEKPRKGQPTLYGRATKKQPIIGAGSRKGNVVARVIDKINSANLQGFVHEVVSDKVSILITDQFTASHGLRKSFPHKTVNHAAKQYVVGAIHTNTIEGFWSLFKRGVVGSYHKISRKYLPLYIAEFQFRYNNRDNEDIFGAAIAAC